MATECTPSSDKIMDLEQVLATVERLRNQGKRIVFTNGCFDVLHRGHVQTLEVAAAQADFLIVAINSDESIGSVKGPGRPLQPR